MFAFIPMTLSMFLFSLLTPPGMEGIGTTLMLAIINFPSSLISLLISPITGYGVVILVGSIQYYFMGFYLKEYVENRKK